MPSIYTFFCDKDWGKIDLSLTGRYIFYKIDHYSNQKIPSLNFSEINKNISKTKSYITNDSYLCMEEGTDLLPRKTLRGTYAVDQLLNEQSIVISLGGEYKNAIVCGTIGTIAKNKISNDIYKEWIKATKKNAIKIKNFYVGTELVESLKYQEKRFATDLSSPIESDLSYD